MEKISLRIIHLELFMHTSMNIIFKIIICLLVNTFLLFSTAFLSQENVRVHAHLSKCWRGIGQRKFDNTCPKPSPVATGELWWA